MIIPKLHYIAEGDSPKTILENIQKACTSGAELVRFGMENASEKKVLKIAKEAIKITSHYQTRLIISGFYKVAKEVKADGVYLEKADSCPTIARKYLHTWQSIGGAANTLEDCEALLDKEIDYINLGPFKSTFTKDSLNPALGLKGYTAITDVLKTPIPIIGFGGITLEDVPDLLKADISGIAVSHAITQNFDSIRDFNKLLNASSTQEQRHTFEA
ncbi:thiamine phosphate synthase [Lacinutrix algicola]|uniref:thiamine phosphate synthase n=1 Tax=Lacinutrix algicola TaxID=342954 RepID=UPI0006E27F18|nr:thiamine phosphate synthase [Lacinutrix algicola]